MIRCTRCTMPNTRPDTAFEGGLCSACIAYDRRATIDWERRRRDLMELLDRHDGRVIVPSSGGKDSTYQVMTLLELGASVTVVTASTCQLTPTGRRNIDNLKRHAPTIEYSPNTTVRAKLNRLALEMVGDISWPEHVAIFTTPFNAAIDLCVPLIMYGENPQNQYGGPMEALTAHQMTRRWVSEFGGQLGLRPEDLIGTEGLTEKQLAYYRMPSNEDIQAGAIEAHFLGHYLPWSSFENTTKAIEAGLKPYLEATPPSPANCWVYENLDNAQTGLHDHGMYRKYGYGRGCAQISVDIREGRATRAEAIDWLRQADGIFPHRYAGVDYMEVLQRIGMSDGAMWRALKRHTNWDLFQGLGENGRPILKEEAWR